MSLDGLFATLPRITFKNGVQGDFLYFRRLLLLFGALSKGLSYCFHVTYRLEPCFSILLSRGFVHG